MKTIQFRRTLSEKPTKRHVASNEGFRVWLNELGLLCFLDPDGIQVAEYDVLDGDVIYGPGPAIDKSMSLKRTADEMSNETDVAELIHKKLFVEAWKQLLIMTKGFTGDGEKAELDNDICSPFKVEKTWKGGDLELQLRDQARIIERNIMEGKSDNRIGRVVGIRLGSGCGKSHLLLEAPKILKAHGIYITYNLSQHLKFDIENPKVTVLLRILLRVAQVPNKNCPDFFRDDWTKSLLSLDIKALQPFVVFVLGTIDDNIFIGVDEIMELKNVPCVRLVLSQLGDLAHDCYCENNRRQCNVFVTSLNEEPFTTASGRDILPWAPTVPDKGAVEFILRSYMKTSRALDRCEAIAVSSSGFHFRSIVFAAQAILKHAHPTVPHVLREVYARWKVKVSQRVFDSVKEYVLEMCKGGASSLFLRQLRDQVEVYLDREGAIPPPLICGAFGVINNEDQVDVDCPLYGVFNCDYAFVDAAKHLESFGSYFDFFRQSYGLSVLPETAKIVVHGSSKAPKWFMNLQYPTNMVKSDEPLFCRKGQMTSLSAHGKSPLIDNYYTPQIVNHPFIDRAFIAQQENGEQCFVLIQDKVNDDVPKAVQGLNMAADILKKEHSQMEVLCILNVIGASQKTTAQNKLRYPYVMVRDSELTSFYSPNFAPVARFVRQRHLLGLAQHNS